MKNGVFTCFEGDSRAIHSQTLGVRESYLNLSGRVLGFFATYRYVELNGLTNLSRFVQGVESSTTLAPEAMPLVVAEVNTNNRDRILSGLKVGKQALEYKRTKAVIDRLSPRCDHTGPP